MYIRQHHHRKSMVCMCSFPYNSSTIVWFKENGGRYSRTYKSWYLSWNKENVAKLNREFPEAIFEKRSKTSEKPNPRRRAYLTQLQEVKVFRNKLLAQNYSASSIRTYTHLVNRFVEFVGTANFNQEDLTKYLVKCRKEMFSASTMRQITSAVKLFANLMSIKDIDVSKISYPRKSNPLPKVLSVEDVRKILDETTNLKHKAIIATLYSTGIRRGEILRLKVPDIDGNRNTIRINNSKGNKDRIVPLSDMLKRVLREYYIKYQPNEYLFEGAKGGIYSAASISQIIAKAAFRAKLKIRVSAHMLRHSFATHLMEQGVNLRVIQEMLGHKSSRTTEIYTKVSSSTLAKVPNPLDSLFVETNDRLPF